MALSNTQFASFTCLNPPSCSLTQLGLVADATINLSVGAGSSQVTLIVDSSPGGTCNIVDESIASSFANGTIFTHAHHEDCAIHGLRIDATFQVTGGSGAFQGATGGRREFGAEAATATAKNPLIFIGTITF
jgi:hypothetical protein